MRHPRSIWGAASGQDGPGWWPSIAPGQRFARRFRPPAHSTPRPHRPRSPPVRRSRAPPSGGSFDPGKWPCCCSAEPVCAGTHHPPAGDRLTHKIAVPCPAEGIVHPGRSNALGGVKAQVGLHPSGGTGPCKTAAPVVIVVQRTVIRAVVDHGSSPGLGQAHHVRGQLGLQRQPGVAVCGDRQPKGTVVSGLLPDKIAGHLHGLTLILLLVPGRAAVVDAALPARLPVGPGEGVLHPSTVA